MRCHFAKTGIKNFLSINYEKSKKREKGIAILFWWAALLPFFLQAIAIGFDEIYFHYKRGLPKWERIGHPLDTFSVLVALGFLVFFPFTPFSWKIYLGISLFSCVMVTKDEFIHKSHCPASENWLHALLFVLHPITLFAAGSIWYVHHTQNNSFFSSWLIEKEFLFLFLQGQLIVMTLFFLYQIIFWNIIWKEKPVIKY